MSHLTIGIVDYGLGNHASITQSLRLLGLRVRVSSDPAVLDQTNLLILPGVGAFPSAMKALSERSLVNYLQARAREQKPLIGICLGMQLLASSSTEITYSTGLNLIPGEVLPLYNKKWHIAWNTLECMDQKSFLHSSDGQAFYFNHSYHYHGPPEYQIGITRHPDYPQPFASVISRGNVVGVQFHPEKSQAAGRELLKNLIADLTNA